MVFNFTCNFCPNATDLPGEHKHEEVRDSMGGRRRCVRGGRITEAHSPTLPDYPGDRTGAQQ